MIKRRDVLKGSVLLLLLQRHQIAFGASIVAVRLWPAQDYTRITLESDTKLSAKFLLVDQPHRMAIDIAGLQLNSTLQELVKKTIPNDPFVNNIRVGQNSPEVVRIVLDLKQVIKPQVFSLDPVAPYQHRLVFDLYPEHEVDPLANLLSSITLATSEKTTASDDAIGQLLKNIGRPPSASSEHDPLAGILGDLNKPKKPVEPVVASAPQSTPAPEVKPVATPAKPAASAPAKPTSNAKVKASSQNQLNNLIIVAIDPGHGGEDPGAVGPKKTREKDVVLQMALKLRTAINKQRNMRAVLIRDADFFVPLNTRVTKARRLQADLFISIHADAFTKPTANGISVFALSTKGASSTMARFLATKENQSDLIGGANIKGQNKQTAKMLLEYSTEAQIRQSIHFGTALLGHLGKVGRLHKKQVERANFAVLRAPDIPSVLVETGFITNPQEEKNLRSATYQNKIVAAITSGILQYFRTFPSTRKNRKV